MIIDMLRVHRDGGESSIIDMLLVHRDAPMSIDTLRVHRDGGESSSIELLEPAAGSLPGDRVYVEGLTDDSVSHTAPPLPPPLNPKKKIWDKLQVLYTALLLLTITTTGLHPLTCRVDEHSVLPMPTASLHWLPIQSRINLKLACFVFSSLSGHAPSCLSDDIHLVSEGPRRHLRSSTDRSCVVPRTYNTFGD